jgi:hypothetical protein
MIIFQPKQRSYIVSLIDTISTQWTTQMGDQLLLNNLLRARQSLGNENHDALFIEELTSFLILNLYLLENNRLSIEDCFNKGIIEVHPLVIKILELTKTLDPKLFIQIARFKVKRKMKETFA